MNPSYCRRLSEANREKTKQDRYYINTLIRFILQYRPLHERKKLKDLTTNQLKSLCKEITADF